MKQIHISAGEGYTVSIGRGLLRDCGALLGERIGPCRAAVVTDDTVGPLYADQVRESLRTAGFPADVFTLPAGEGQKNMETLSQLLNDLAQGALTRQDCVVALGGGVVGDLAGFAAGVYLRGIRFVQIPTTLLAAVDSSVGGKTAVNLSAGKNLAGLFWQPSAVLCDVDCLNTLSGEQLAAGAAEVVKTAVLCGEELFSLLENGGLNTETEAVVAACVAYKAAVVEADPREQGPRRALNLGHTFGHAIERCSGYAVPHGQAVAMGLAIITRIAAAKNRCDKAAARRILQLLKAQGLPTETEFSPEALANAALHDKKRHGDTLALVLPTAIGSHAVWEIPVSDLAAVAEMGLRKGETE